MLAALRLARRLQVGVLLLWACCLGVAVASPWIGGGTALRPASVCGEHGGAQWTADLAGGPGKSQARALDCPMCMPLGAAQPIDFAIPVPTAMPDAPTPVVIGTARSHEGALRPPARAPPQRIPNQEVTS